MINLRHWRRSTPLQIQLLVSHFLVMLTGVLLVLLFNRLYRTNLGSAMEVFLAGLLTLILVSMSVGQLIIHPLKQLEKTMQAVAAGKLDARVTLQHPPELRHLGVQLNYLAESVRGMEEQRQEWLDDLLHEMRSPISTLHANLRLLQSDYSDLIGEPLDWMLEETARLQRLATETYHLAEIDRYFPVKFERVEIATLLHQTLNALQLAQTQAPSIELYVPASLPMVYADQEQVRAIVTNLLNNAIAYTPVGKITIRAWKSGNKVWIEILDTGIGIAPEDLPHVCDRGWRSAIARYLRPGGSGLGLAIAERLIQLQGGKLEVESQLGQGSTFRFWLATA